MVKCFHGCSASDVVRAVGLELHDLFPKAEWNGDAGHQTMGGAALAQRRARSFQA